MKKIFLLLAVSSAMQAAPVALFDGKSFANWDIPKGEEKWWQIKDGMLVGGSLEEKITKNLFLPSSKDYQNFDLTYKIRLVPGEGFMNSGLQIRSKLSDDGLSLTGYQVDAGVKYWGDLYDEHRRGKLTGPQDPAALAAVVKDWEWNEYRILCEGRRIRSWINGVQTLDFTEPNGDIPMDGRFAIQVHGGGTLLVQLKDMMISELPDTPGAASWDAKPPTHPTPDAKDSKARTPEEERQSFRLPEGFVAELVSSEEQGAGKPITMTWDGRGRMWTMSALEYPVDGNTDPAKAQALYASGGADKVMIFDEPNKSSIQTPRFFADELAIPLGILPDLDGNAALVQHGSQIRRYVDANQDGKADKFDVILDGFGIQDSHLMPHQFERAPGGWIYVAQGLFNYSKVYRPNGLAFADGTREKDYGMCKLARFRPDGSQFDLVSAGPNNIWGLFQTREGETYLQEANDGGHSVAEFEFGTHYPGGSKEMLQPYAPYIPRAVSAAMGGSGLSGLALAEDLASPFAKHYSGDHVIFVANPITNRIQVISTDTADDKHTEYFLREDFLVTDDPWFRPVAIHFGPDGCLYIADWYNKIISHNEVPRDHPERDKTRGRIWRIRPANSVAPAQVDFTKLKHPEVIALLGGKSARTATMAWQWLGERMDAVTAAQLTQIVSDSQGSEPIRLDAFWALELGKAVQAPLLEQMFADPSAHIRYQAIRAAGEMQLAPERFAKIFQKAPDDSNYRVRAALANSVRNHKNASAEMIRIVAKLGRPSLSSSDRWDVYDRSFERYLARWAMQTHREQTLSMLEKPDTLDQENRMLAILSLDAKQAASLLANEVENLPRNLSAEEMSVLSSQIDQAPILAVLQRVLANKAKRISILNNLTQIETKHLSNPFLSGLVYDTCAAVMATPMNPSDRALVIKLARLFRLSKLEEPIFKLIQDTTPVPELIELLTVLREIGSARVDLFEKYLDHPDESLRREATSALASCENPKAIELLNQRWDKLPAALRLVVLDGLTSSKEKASAFANAISNGKFPPPDQAVFEKLFLVLGEEDASLKSLLEKSGSKLGKVIRLTGLDQPSMQKNIDLNGAFTVESWIKLEPGVDNADSLLGNRAGAMDFNFNTGKLHIYSGSNEGNIIIMSQPIAADTWLHIAVTRDEQGAFKIYRNGELDPAKGRAMPLPMSGLRIGEAIANKPNKNSYDEFRVWKVARTAEEIARDYRLKMGAKAHPELVARYNAEHGAPWVAGAEIAVTLDLPLLLSAEQTALADQRYKRFEAMAQKPGDPVAGRGLFQASCMICHQVKGKGVHVGPDLSGVGSMGLQAVLRNILDPNAQLESGYYRHDITLTDGSFLSGFLEQETAEALTIRQIGSDPKTIPRANVAKHNVSKRSLMPEGLIDGLSEQQVADFFSYIKSVK
jgi:putative membrane-bound dehydrogenase-like protein